MLIFAYVSIKQKVQTFRGVWVARPDEIARTQIRDGLVLPSCAVLKKRS